MASQMKKQRNIIRISKTAGYRELRARLENSIVYQRFRLEATSSRMRGMLNGTDTTEESKYLREAPCDGRYKVDLFITASRCYMVCSTTCIGDRNDELE
jgi:hypothetical protein